MQRCSPSFEADALDASADTPDAAAVELHAVLRSLTPGWLCDATLRGAALRLDFPARAALRREEVPALRLLLDGLVGDAIDVLRNPGGSVVVRVSFPTGALLRLSVRRVEGAERVSGRSAPASLQTAARDAAFDLLREVVRAQCGRLNRQRTRSSELVCVDLPRLA